MTQMELAPLLRCPSCKASHLQKKDSCYSCMDCSRSYPVVGGIPWLFPEPEASLAEWKLQCAHLLKKVDVEIEEIKSSLNHDSLTELAGKRLKKQMSALQEQKKCFQEILSPLIKEEFGSFTVLDAIKAKLPTTQNLLSYFGNIFRDWSYGQKENEASLACIAEVLGEAKPESILVLGAGAGRLAYDLHQHYAPALTIATDINPLMLFAAESVINGRGFKLYEFPRAPKDSDHIAVAHKMSLSKEQRPKPGLHLIFSDVVIPPFGEGSFDLVISPWFIDIVSDRPKDLFKRINWLLKPGGKWVNFGSLAFEQESKANQLGPDEIKDLTQRNGFKWQKDFWREIPYLCSPASNHGRIERVWSFLAIKEKPMELPGDTRSGPDWLFLADKPVPNLKEFGAFKTIHQVYLDVIGQIDGKSSIQDMAKSFGTKHGLPEEQAVASIRNFLMRTWEEVKKNRG